MTHDEFCDKFGIDATYDEYTNKIEPLYTAADMDKYVFMCENFDEIIKGRKPYINDKRHDTIYKIQCICEANHRIFNNKAIQNAFSDIRLALKTCYHKHFIAGENISKLQLDITTFFRGIKTIAEFKPVAVMLGDTIQIMLHDIYGRKYYNAASKKYYDYRSLPSCSYLRFVSVDTINFK